MKKRPTTGLWLTKLIGIFLIVILTGCPFTFGDDDSIGRDCTKNEDCRIHEVCLNATGTCNFESPPPQDNKIVGPFACITSANESNQISQNAIRITWPETTDNDGNRFLGGDSSLGGLCLIFLGTTKDNLAVGQLLANGPLFTRNGRVVFVRLRLTLPADTLAFGERKWGTLENGWAGLAYLCPEAVYKVPDIDDCAPFKLVERGSVSINWVEEVRGLPTLVRGYLNLEVNP